PGTRSVARRVRFEQRDVQHGELRGEGLIAVRRVDEEVAREEAVPGELGDDTDRQPVARIGPDVAVQREDVLAAQILPDSSEERVEARRVDLLVVGPVDVRLAARLPHEELVLRRAAGVLAGVGAELPVRAEDRLTAAQSLLVELGDALVAIDRPDTAEAEGAQMVFEGLGWIR